LSGKRRRRRRRRRLEEEEEEEGEKNERQKKRARRRGLFFRHPTSKWRQSRVAPIRSFFLLFLDPRG